MMVLLCLPLAMGEPGPCRHSITRNHLLTLRRLIDNQLQNGCSITYTFIERRNLSKCCYVKAALPCILELLTSHFRYTRGSENHSYVLSLTGLIHNIYSQQCVPQINEELEDDPVSFGMSVHSTPSEALWRVHGVLSEYWELVTSSDSPVDWSCEQEYTDTARPTELSLTTVSSSWESEKVSQTGLDVALDRDLTFGFTMIVLSVCGGLLFIITLYCLITHKMSHCEYHHTSLQVNQIPGLHTEIQDLEMQGQ
ncbi:macrophage colony-stimulating factor 1b isoform X2 [Esox lucius]|nr:macrophage colony-stimulating factor 1b isoform X2 [Esox lucius]XP_012987853.2 macrophage colony-stimulating factor 1b isoform X2 [Esox lucius]